MAIAESLFEPVETIRSSERVADAICRVIIEGKIRPGETLPPERTLAERFHVTRNTVREALRTLEQLRLVTIRQGSGIRVQDYLATAGLEFVSSLLGSRKADVRPLMRDIAEARAAIGEAMVRNAIANLSEDALDGIAEAVEAFCEEARRRTPDARRLQQLDFEIHNRLMRAGGNRAIILLHNSIRHIYEHVAELFVPLVKDPQLIADGYRQILEALRKGDRERAKELFRAYFEAGRLALTAMLEG